MPIFRIDIDRKVTNWDRFTRYVEAETQEAAQALGKTIATGANSDCPDEFVSSLFDDEYGDWAVNEVAEADDFDLEAATNDELQALSDDDKA